MTRWRPYLVGERSRYTYYPNTSEVGLGAAAELRGQSFTVLADVTVDGDDTQGVLFKQGGAHGGPSCSSQAGGCTTSTTSSVNTSRSLVSPDPIPLGRHIFGVQYQRTGTVEGSHASLGDTTLYVDDAAVATLDGMQTHPGMFALAGGGICIGRNTGSAVSQQYRAPFAFGGGTIGQVTVDLSGEPYRDLEGSSLSRSPRTEGTRGG